ncbi:MAG: hypothetical protein ABI400_09785 [Lacisediminihabitans sp.]
MTRFFGSAGPAVTVADRGISETRIAPYIEVQAISNSQWRVCDTRWPEHDARCVLGFIEKRADVFEALQIRAGLVRRAFGTLAEAQRYFSN